MHSTMSSGIVLLSHMVAFLIFIINHPPLIFCEILIVIVKIPPDSGVGSLSIILYDNKISHIKIFYMKLTAVLQNHDR